MDADDSGIKAPAVSVEEEMKKSDSDSDQEAEGSLMQVTSPTKLYDIGIQAFESKEKSV